MAIQARNSGYVLPPAAITDKPGLVSSLLAGWSGKIKTQQEASMKNQEVTNRLAAEGLGLPKDTVLNPQVFEDVRAEAGKAYANVVKSIPQVSSDPAFQAEVAALGGANSTAARISPNITANPGIQGLRDELMAVPSFPTEAGVEVVKELRLNGNQNLKAIGDPSRHALGMAQREAADAIDNLMERNIVATGKTDVISAYREARRLIAKSYDVEGATNSATGDVNARGLARLAVKGRPLTDQLKEIADAALAFPKAMQTPAGLGTMKIGVLWTSSEQRGLLLLDIQRLA